MRPDLACCQHPDTAGTELHNNNTELHNINVTVTSVRTSALGNLMRVKRVYNLIRSDSGF